MYIFYNFYIKVYSFATKLSIKMAMMDQNMKYYKITNSYS